MTSSPAASQARPLDWLIFVLSAVFFSTNLIFGRGISADVAPFVSAFLRWSGAAMCLLPFVYSDRAASLHFMRRHTGLWLLLGFLGMGICGGGVYWSLHYTTASNATLIYTTSSLFIILLEWLIRGRKIVAREIAGMVIAFAGVTVIVLKGDIEAARHFRFNIGDLGILAAAVAWAAYSLLLKRPAVGRLAPLSLFGTICIGGALLLAPIAVIEVIRGEPVPDSLFDWSRIAGIILFASLAAFSCFQHAVRVFGASTAGLSLYLMPPISIVLAVVLLGESFEAYHVWGIVLVMGGIILATAPFRRKRRQFLADL